MFDLEEDVLDFDDESLGGSEVGGSEEDTLQLHDSDSDSLERLMEQIEEELSSPVKSTRLKQKPTGSLPSTKENYNSGSTSMFNYIFDFFFFFFCFLFFFYF